MNKEEFELSCDEIEAWSIWVYEGITGSEYDVPDEETKYYLDNILYIEIASGYSYRLIKEDGLPERTIAEIQKIYNEILELGYLNK